MQQRRQLNIGIVEDDQIMGSSLIQRFELDGHIVHWWKTGSDAINSLEFFDKDIIICDIQLPDITGESVLRQAGRDGQAPPFLFITGYGEIDQAVRLMRLGACDYITKPFEFDDFLKRVERNARTSSELRIPPEALGVSTEMRELQQNLVKFSQTDFPVLITGEPGVGKESSARFLHAHSKSAGQPFMSVNCAAIPLELLEKEIFGVEGETEKGTDDLHKGYAERVGSGTLYIREFTRIPLTVQAKLLNLIDEASFVRIGGKQTRGFHGRIVVSDSSDLESVVAKGVLREDLLFKLSVLTVHITPLRNRPDDIGWLLPQMVSNACNRQGQLMKALSAQAEEASLEHDWVGNALEMRNRVDRGVALSRDHELTVADIFPEVAGQEDDRQGFSSLAQAREAAEKRQIMKALERSEGQIGETAKLLGVSRTTLWDKMSRLDIGAKGRSDS